MAVAIMTWRCGTVQILLSNKWQISSFRGSVLGVELDPNLQKVDWAAGDHCSLLISNREGHVSNQFFLKTVTNIAVVFTVAIMMKVALV